MKHSESENLEIRTATLKYTCDAETRLRRRKKATTAFQSAYNMSLRMIFSPLI